jgi:hypothetical protein
MSIRKTSYLTSGYGLLEEALRRTEPGMADIVDLGSLHNCEQCGNWRAIEGKDGQGRCALYERLTRDRKGAKPKPLRARQQACRKWLSDLGDSSRLPDQGTMTSIATGWRRGSDQVDVSSLRRPPPCR